MASISWLNKVTGNWATAADWTGGAAPTSADDTILGLVGNYTVSITGADQAKTLTFDAPGATLLETAAGSLTLSGALTVNHGIARLNAAGANTYTGTTTIQAGRNLFLTENGTLGAGAVIDNGALDIDRTMTLGNAISGSGILVKENAGTLTINRANSFTGGTEIGFGGSLAVGNAGALGTGTLFMNGSSGSVNLLGTITETLTNPLIISRASNISAAHGKTLTLNGSSGYSLALDAYLSFGGGGNDGIVVWRTPGGSSVDSTSSVHVLSGTLKAGDASFSTLLANASSTDVAAGAKIDIAGFGTSIHNLTGAGVVTTSVAAAQPLKLNGLAGDFAGRITGALSLEVAENAYLSGANTYTGTTTIDAGALLSLGNGGTTGSIGAGAIADASFLIFERGNSFTLANAISGTGAVEQAGAGTTAINTANTYSGGTFIVGGTLAAGDPGALGSGKISIYNGGELLGTVNETLANRLDMSGTSTIAAAHGATVNTSGSWTFHTAGAVLNFGAAGQDGIVVWHTMGATILGDASNPGAVDVRAGTLQAGDSGLDFLFTGVGSTGVETGAKIDIAGFDTEFIYLLGSGAIINSAGIATVTLRGAAFSGTLSGAMNLDVSASGYLAGTTDISGVTWIESGVSLDNFGTFMATNDVTGADVTSVFTNDGLFEKISPSIILVTAQFVNYGTVFAAKGEVQFLNTFDNIGIVQGVLSFNGVIWTVTANAPGQTTYFGGSGDNHFTIATAPTYLDGGAGTNTVEVTQDMTFAGSLANVQKIQVDDVLTVNFSKLADGENIVIASFAGGGSTVTGTQGSDRITGGEGNDIIDGGPGKDVLTGGASADAFMFDAVLSPANVDRVKDFSPAEDQMWLSKPIFTGLTDSPSHVLLAGEFVIGPAALDSGDRIVYDSSTGKVYYDADGNGAGAQVLFAILSPALALTHDDFRLV